MILIEFKKLIRKIDTYSPYPFFYIIRMTTKERSLFDKYIKNADHYLEFGSGGSTIRALQKSKAKVYSVESSIEWINMLKRYRIISNSIEKRLFFHYVDIGETKKYGFPKATESRELFPKYSTNVFQNINYALLDTVLIDGRFRVACALSVVLNVTERKNIVILFHDFWQRERYHVILKYLNVIDKTDSFAVFKIKEKIDYEAVKKDFEIFKYIAN